MDLSLIYRALADGQVDLIAGDATSGLIDAYGLVMLEDDRRYFPPYDAVPLIRQESLQNHPELRQVLSSLGGKISEQDMRAIVTDALDFSIPLVQKHTHAESAAVSPGSIQSPCQM